MLRLLAVLFRNRNISCVDPLFAAGTYIDSDWFDLFIEVSRMERSQEKYPNLEVQSDQREDEGFQILYQVIEYAKSFGIRRFRDIYQRADFRSLRGSKSAEEDRPASCGQLDEPRRRYVRCLT